MFCRIHKEWKKYNLRLTFQLKHNVTCCGRPHLDSLQTPLLEKHPRITISEHCFAAPFWNTRFEHNFKTQLRNTLSGLSFGPPCPNAVAQTSFDTASGDSFGTSLLHTASENNLASPCAVLRQINMHLFRLALHSILADLLGVRLFQASLAG